MYPELPAGAIPTAFFAAGVAVVSVSLPDKFQTREYRFIRAIVFTMLGMWGVVPVTHLLLTHGHVWAIWTAFKLDVLMGVIYLVSTAVCLCCVLGGKGGAASAHALSCGTLDPGHVLRGALLNRNASQSAATDCPMNKHA
jgi:hypothetical protein